MYAPCCLAFLLFFLMNVSRNGTEFFVSGSTHASSRLPRSFRQASCSRNVHHFPCQTKFRGLSVLLLLCGDISLNPGPISFGVVNCQSVRNKGPSISDIMSTHSLSLLASEAALLAANALVGSRLDYCNSLFRSLSALELCRLQCVQNSLARIVANTTKYSHITPVRKSLHWLPIVHRSIFKVALLVYKFLHSGHPKYFEPFLKPRHSMYRTRRSQSQGVLLEVLHFASIYKTKNLALALHTMLR